jgi:hypothetical protein
VIIFAVFVRSAGSIAQAIRELLTRVHNTLEVLGTLAAPRRARREADAAPVLSAVFAALVRAGAVGGLLALLWLAKV